MDFNDPLTLNFIKKFEGYAPKPAWDYRQHSVGYGTKWTPGQPVGTKQDHESALAREAGAVNSWIDRNVKTQVSPQQRAALNSFGFNLGTDDLDRLLPDINAGNWNRVGQRMLSFNKAGGQTLPGLVDRRKQEASLLLGGPVPEMSAQPSSGAPMPGPNPINPVNGTPIPMLPPPPSQRKSKLADALLASAAQAKPQNWGDLLNAGGDLALGYVLGDKYDTEQKAYRSKLAEALGGATNENLASTLIGSGDDNLVNAGVQLKVAQAKPQATVGRFRPSKQGIVDTVTGQIVPGTASADTESAEYGTSPQYYKDKDGKLRIGQLSKAGGMKAVDLPEGGEAVLPGIDKVDAGTEYVFRDKRTGEVVGTQPKNIAGRESAEATGKAAGQAVASLPSVKTTVENAFKTINELRNHPGRATGTGLSSRLDPRNYLAGTDATDFSISNRQAKAQSFMAAREGLKGAGQVTDFEGGKGEDAIAALDSAQSDAQYLKALDNLERMMKASYDDLVKKANMGGPIPGSAPAAVGQVAPAAPSSAPPPVPNARQAPDGNWYVQQNGQWFKVEQ